MFTSQKPGHHEEQVIERFFISCDSLPRVSALLNLGCWYNTRPEQERVVLEKLGVPVINGIILSTNQKDWEKSSKADAIKKIIKAYHTDEVKKVVEETSDGLDQPVW